VRTAEVKLFDDIAIRQGICGDGFMVKKATASHPINASARMNQKRVTGDVLSGVKKTAYTCSLL
jgi:hypothetical protein